MIVPRIVGSVAGVGFCMATIAGIEKLAHMTLGAPVDPAQASAPMQLAVLAGWVVGTGVGGLIGSGIAKWGGVAWIVAALVALGTIVTALTITQPWWMTAAGVILPLLVAALIARRGGGAADQRVAL